jgi:hypothetical protein
MLNVPRRRKSVMFDCVYKWAKSDLGVGKHLHEQTLLEKLLNVQEFFC